MKLSSPIYVLKRKAKSLARVENIPLHQALDRIAQHEGFAAWSLLASKFGSSDPDAVLLKQLKPGELLLIGSPPRQGKTLLSLGLAIRALQKGRHAAFFTLEMTKSEVLDRFTLFEEDPEKYTGRFDIHDSDEICSEYIVAALQTAPPDTLVVIDYLQLLDQRRTNPDLNTQVAHLKQFAVRHGVTIVCLSQIARTYNPKNRAIPGVRDVRLPNPLDLFHFDKMCFLNEGKMEVETVVSE